VTSSLTEVKSRIAVLIVEDEAIIRMDIVSQLSDAGFDVFEAGTADEAVSLLEANASIRILFTDIDMPGSMDGLKLAVAVRDRWPPIKIVVTSGHHVIEKADLPDGSVFFSKPYHHRRIMTSFRELLSS
jgi:CheY-like chemotaxis protein